MREDLSEEVDAERRDQLVANNALEIRNVGSPHGITHNPYKGTSSVSRESGPRKLVTRHRDNPSLFLLTTVTLD